MVSSSDVGLGLFIEVRTVRRVADDYVEAAGLHDGGELHRPVEGPHAREAACHALITYDDRMPAEVWYDRPDVTPTYCSTTAHFAKKTHEWTPAIDGNYWFGHHYQIFRMAHTFLKMAETRVEPVPHQEILEVTAIIAAAAKSVNERSRLVELAEVM